MRTLFVKQSGDPFGPWSPVEYRREDPESILRKFYYKPTMWEMTCCLQADWKIVPSHGDGVFNRYVARFERLARLLAGHQTGVVAVSAIDFSAYDVVISIEACLTEDLTSRYPDTLFLYFMNEHDNDEYAEQLKTPAAGYDYFCDHMCGGPGAGEARSLSMPYLRAPDVVRHIFPRYGFPVGPPRVWIDARSIARAALHDSAALWTPSCDRYVAALAAEHGVEILYRANIYRDYYDVQDPSNHDAWCYYADMRRADYFIGVAATGAGQALCDGASLGLACVGTPALAYHRMTCAPAALCDDLASSVALVKRWHDDRSVRASVLEHQDAALALEMRQGPVERLEQARRRKLAPHGRSSAARS
jgi:hypothetical protein